MSKPYQSKLVSTDRLRIGRVSGFKVYFISITGRKEKEKYEWGHSCFSTEQCMKWLQALTPEGVGFITTFPHITKVFSFGPEPETNLYVKAYTTATGQEIPLQQKNGTLEVACAAEMEIAADEFVFWANVNNVEEYLKRYSNRGTTAIADHTKLQRYSQGKERILA